MNKAKTSVVIIYARDCDKELLTKAKKSVGWCDELVLVSGESGSFSDWRNSGLKRTKGEWVLYLDSDEEVSIELKKEILNLIKSKNDTFSYYAIPRSNIIFNKVFKYGGQYPDYQKRLFKKDNLLRWIGEVHEEPVVTGQIGYLKSDIIHHKNMTISQMIDKTNKWSEIESNLMLMAGHPKMNIFRFLSAGTREFILRFVKQKSFMDGKEGIIYGIYQIYSRLVSYSKLWEKQQLKTRI